MRLTQDTNEAYNDFILTFCTIYDTFFPMNKMKIKTEDLESPWVTKGIKKSEKNPCLQLLSWKRLWMSDLIALNIICFQTQKQVAILNDMWVLLKSNLIDLHARNLVHVKTTGT